MRLPPCEHDKLLLHQLGSLAQQRLARSVKFNHTEATALIASQLHEYIRDGKHSVAELMQLGKMMLGRRHVLPSVPALLHEIHVEGTFPDGVFLVTVHNPISSYWIEEPLLYASSAAPGGAVVRRESIVLNQGRDRIRLCVTNKGDRPIQVGSHYRFIESNPSLDSDREKAYGRRLDIPAGTAVRSEPGDVKSVNLVGIGGAQIISGGNGLPTSHTQSDSTLTEILQRGFAHTPEPGALSITESKTMSREADAGMFGPTTGDRVRLGDTELWIEAERDFTVYGDECKFGDSKLLREEMGQATNRSHTQVLGLLIIDALATDWSGIYKVSTSFLLPCRTEGAGGGHAPDTIDVCETCASRRIVAVVNQPNSTALG